jgi:hypothetical protein
MDYITSYYDIGSSVGSFMWTYFLPDGQLNQNAIDAYFDSLFSTLKNAGFEQIMIAFCNVQFIDAYYSKNYRDNSLQQSLDPLAAILHQLSEVIDLLDYMVKKAHANNLKIGLSFGGVNAQSDGWNFLPTSGETYAGQASKLAAAISSYNLDSIDFDYEYASTLNSEAYAFFSSLHTALQGKVPMTLTVQMAADWYTTYLTGFFTEGGATFSNFFDGINLMAYDGGTQYYLDPVRPSQYYKSWSLPEWEAQVGGYQYLNVGFYDKVPYADKSANGGTYDWWTEDSFVAAALESVTSNGVAAGILYNALIKKLGNLGKPFFWPSECNNFMRYVPVKDGLEVVGCKFVSHDMINFFKTIQDGN